jgi:hypothetical protein
MSLAAIADHMASKGRGPDSMLIHMSPREVQGLQALAMKNGGSLTINPDTGLPEAGFLDKLLPTIIGAGLTFFSGGAINPMMAAGIVGGVQTVRTGDLGKGLAAGLGAYGGAGITQGLTAAGTSALGSQAAGAGAGLTGDMAFNLADAGVSEAGIQSNVAAANQALQQQAAERVAAASPFDKLSAGAKSVAENPMRFANKDNFKYLAAAAGPILADQAIKSNMPTTVTKPGMIRPYSFDPYGGTYTAGTPYETVPTKAAGGGLMGMANERFNFARSGGPVVGMADGGIARYAIGGDTKLALEEAYGAGDYNKVNDLIAQNKISEADVGNTWKGFDTAGAAGLGVNYFAQNKDVADAFANNNYGMTQDQFAQTHYDKFGQTEGRTLGNADSGVNTGGGLPALNAAAATPYYFQVNPDVAAEYTRNPLGLTPEAFAQAHFTNFGQKEGREFEPSAAVKYATANKTDIAENTQKWIDANPFATTEQINAAITGSGMSKGDVDRALGALVESGKISGSERYYIQQGKGLSAMADNTAKWLKDNPNATQTDIDAALKASSMDIGDAQQVLAHGFQVADKDLSAATQYIKDNPDVARWITSAQGQEYIKKHPEFDVKDIAYTHYKRYGEKEGRNWGAPTGVVPGDEKLDTATTYDNGAFGNYGSGNKTGKDYLGNTVSIATPGDIITNPDMSRTMTPNIPGRPYGGFTGIDALKSAYTAGGGSLGYTPTAPKTIDEFNTSFNKLSGGSKAAYDYLMGKTPYSPTPYTPTGEIQKPYFESVGKAPVNLATKKYIFKDGKYELNPAYVKPPYVLAAEKAAAGKETTKTDAAAGKSINVLDAQGNTEQAYLRDDGFYYSSGGTKFDEKGAQVVAGGGLMAMARGGMSQFDLGGYSDGGRLLRGPGDGVSDSIPATIGNKRPARLADGEFVVPARIVSELGNGSTEAGARKLYAMMDRVQAARRGSIGKGKVAKNTRAAKYLPA